jgi:serine/threonine protein kinase
MPKEDDQLGLITARSSTEPLNSNLIVAFCLDGTVYALDAGNGAILWRTSGSFTDGPLLKKRRRIRTNGNVTPPLVVDYLIEPLGEGAIFQMTEGEGEQVKRLPFTLKSLVHLSPVHWQESEERALYLIAKRESSIYVLDLEGGNVKKRQFKNKSSHKNICNSSDEEMAVELSERASLLVGRTDYHVQGFDEGNLEAQWEITLTQFKTLHNEMEMEISEKCFNGNNFYTTFNGHLVSKQAERPWIAKLNSPVLQIFRPMKTAKGFVTLQEIRLKGSESGAIVAKRHVLFDQNKATFYFDDLVNVGVLNTNTEEGNSSTLFVLPQSHYPLLRDRKKPIIGEEGIISEVPIVKRHEFLSVQRVSRQVIPPTVKLLDYENQTTSKFGYTLLIAVLGIFGLWFMRRLYKNRQRRLKPRGGALEMSEEVLGYGSHGTVVFRGKFDGRPVAIKRLLSEFYSLADHEIGLLQEHDTHPNVVRYFYREEQERFILVALELADCSLQAYIDPVGRESGSSSANEILQGSQGTEIKNFEGVKVDRRDLLRQVMSGLSFLHEKGLIHRDLKPQNILLQFVEGSVRVLISDFGLSRKLIEMESSFHATAKASGTLGWRAPEIIFNEETVKYRESTGSCNSDQSCQAYQSCQSSSAGSDVNSESSTVYGPVKIGRSVDIFAAGLIFYYVLSGGKHAFGSRIMRESNISTGKLELDTSFLSVEAENLIKEMLRKRAKDRPTAKQILAHPFFWDSEKRLEFICSVSDVLEAEERNIKREQVEKAPPGFESAPSRLPMRDAIDFVGTRVFKESSTWHKDLDRLIFQDITKHRYYMVNKLHDLLRAIRNKRNHYNETPTSVQEILGTSPIEAWEYFESKFPKLLMECYMVMSRFVENLKSLEKYYEKR